jgi:hypothetical protein
MLNHPQTKQWMRTEAAALLAPRSSGSTSATEHAATGFSCRLPGTHKYF